MANPAYRQIGLVSAEPYLAVPSAGLQMAVEKLAAAWKRTPSHSSREHL